jgi:hypothetical protein
MFFTAVRLTSSSEAGLHLFPNSFAVSFGSLGAGYIIRRTGKFWWLTTISAAFPVASIAGMAFLNKDSPDLVTWIAIFPAGLGLSVIITSTLGLSSLL